MPRRKTKKTEEVDTTQEVSEAIETAEDTRNPYEKITDVEVTDEFQLQDVSDVPDTTEEAQLEDLDVTEVESIIKSGSTIEILEGDAATMAAEAEALEKEKRQIKNQRLPRVKPQVFKGKHNNGIRTTQSLFYR